MSVTGELSLEMERSQGDIGGSNQLPRPPSFSQFGNSNFMDSDVSMDRGNPQGSSPTGGPPPPPPSMGQGSKKEDPRAKANPKNYGSGESNQMDSFHIEIPIGGGGLENNDFDSNERFNEFEMTFEVPDLKDDSIAEVNQLRELTTRLSTDERNLSERNNQEEDFQTKISEMFNGYTQHVRFLQDKIKELEDKNSKLTGNNSVLLTTIERCKDEIGVQVKNNRILAGELTQAKKEKETLANKIKETGDSKKNELEENEALKRNIIALGNEKNALLTKIAAMQTKIDFLLEYLGQTGESYNLLATNFRNLALKFQTSDTAVFELVSGSQGLLQNKIIQPDELSAFLERMGPKSGVQTPVKRPGAQTGNSARTRTASPARNPNAKPSEGPQSQTKTGKPQVTSPTQKENEISTNPEVIRRANKMTKPGEKQQPPGSKPIGSKPNTPGPKQAMSA